MEKANIVQLTRGVILLSIAVIGITRIATAQTASEEARTHETRTYATQSPKSTARYTSSELAQGQWRAGGETGLLSGTPDDTAMAFDANADYFVADNLSFGPLAQIAFTGDMFQFGLSGQGKYWIPMPGTNGHGKMALQSGIGFVHSDTGRSDTSWLVPVGIGYEYALDSGMDLTATTLVNFTNLHNGGGADVMPGLTFGLRF